MYIHVYVYICIHIYIHTYIFIYIQREIESYITLRETYLRSISNGKGNDLNNNFHQDYFHFSVKGIANLLIGAKKCTSCICQD